MPMSEANSARLKAGVAQPFHARQRSWIQVTRTDEGSCWSKIIEVGTKTPRGGREEGVIVSLDLFHAIMLSKDRLDNE
jgi:hypothetical protein